MSDPATAATGRIGIIADDLTGAMDTGLQLAKRGLEVLVCIHPARLPEAQAVVVDTETRALEASVAYRRVAEVARAMVGWRVYKKIDSTMRGNIGYELRALLQVLQPRAVVVAPAFPQGGRTTLHGRQLVNGRPLHLTYLAHDPRWPMHEAHIPTLLMQQAGREVGWLGLEQLAEGVKATAHALASRPEPLLVVDALSDEHLTILARALVSLGDAWIPCGSAGLAEAWGEASGWASSQALPPPLPDARPALLVSGSRSDVVRTQLEHVLASGRIARLDLAARGVFDAPDEVARLTRACLAALDEDVDVVLTSSFTPLVAGAGVTVARILGEVAAGVIAARELAGVCLTGGDIAMAFCEALGVQALRILHEVQPGIPGGELVGGRGTGLKVVTKAGGFGDAHALCDVLAYLHGQTRSTTR